MRAHASYKILTPTLMARVLENYLESLDNTKTYFIEAEINQWKKAPDDVLQKIIDDYYQSNFSTFENIHLQLIQAIYRHRLLQQDLNQEHLLALIVNTPLKNNDFLNYLQVMFGAKVIDYETKNCRLAFNAARLFAQTLQKRSALAKQVTLDEFKEMPWLASEELLAERILRINLLQHEMAAKLNNEVRETSRQRILKRRLKYEDEMLSNDIKERSKLMYAHILKAVVSALDSHTAYFTPSEAKQFMINVQQRLYGIGAQLRDDITGFTIVRMVEGGPAERSKQLKNNDCIIAVNGEPVGGMDIEDAVDLIRGEENSTVVLTIVRKSPPNAEKKEDKLEVSLLRGEVVIKEARFKSSYEPYGDSSIGYLKLHSFYQDRSSSSAEDLEKEIIKLKNEHKLAGLILDLRYNSGGLLPQAVDVVGLFISQGVVVSIKDENGRIQHLRNMNTTPLWQGPLIVLVNRMSASASEIVAQTLQDYGRAIIVGDDHTFGKGSYQTFTLTTDDEDQVDPQGEYKVTRGRYYTVSGKTPQLEGVISDIIVPGELSQLDIGEKFAKYPLENDTIKANFDDHLHDISVFQRDHMRRSYRRLQKKLNIYEPYLNIIKEHSAIRLKECHNHANFINSIAKDYIPNEESPHFGQNDLQLEETYAIIKELIFLQHTKSTVGAK